MERLKMDWTFSFRRASPEDRAAVEALCAKIWEGDDYIPTCFDAWAADENGEFLLGFATGPAATNNGPSLIGLGKLSFLSPGEAWLEGLRKDPDSQAKGFGSALCRHFLARLAADPSISSVRFSTYFSNSASIALNGALGFRQVATASCLHVVPSIDSRPAAAPPPDVITDAAEVLDFVRASSWFGPFLHEGWRSQVWDEGVFAARYVDTGSCVGFHSEGRLVALAARSINNIKATGQLPFFDAADPGMGAALAADCVAWFAERGVKEAETFVPAPGLRVLPMLQAAGFASSERLEDYLVFELPLVRLADYRASP
jgi:GNAT superfamily N-acetyltransferase